MYPLPSLHSHTLPPVQQALSAPDRTRGRNVPPHAPAWRRAAIPWALTLWTAAGAAAAQGQPAAASPIETVVITGNLLGRAGPMQPASVLSGDALTLRRATSIGDTVDGLPGVATTGFGPNASRPVIRGLGGDRIRVLENGGASIDASALSFDHAVAVDPLVLDRVEVLRGPAALLYGGNATGGVVNLIDNRIPLRGPLDGAGLGGRVELRGGGAAGERAGAVVLEGGSTGSAGGGLAWHVDAFGRRSSDLRVPRHVPIEDGEPLPAATRVRNSAADAQGGALGLAWVSPGFSLGASVERLHHDYGIAVEEDVTLAMRRERLNLAAEWRELAGPISAVSLRGGSTRYRHDEIEGDGEIGTTFRNRGQDVRVEARHRPLAALGGAEGVFGVQIDRVDASALGEEAFVPDTRTDALGLFLLEEWQLGGARLSAGLRLERVRVRSAGDPPHGDHHDDHDDDHDRGDDDEMRFGPAGERRFSPSSLSLAAQWPLGATAQGGWTLDTGLGRTERAPAAYELYANGLHLATAAYERGDPTLGSERSVHGELGLSWRSTAGTQLRASVFQTRFSRFIALDATGAFIEVEDHHAGHGHDHDADEDTRLVPEYRYRGVRARLHGAELEGRVRLIERPWTLDGSATVDWVRGSNRDSGEPLARLAPMRVRLGLDAQLGTLQLGARLRHAARQSRVPDTDTATPGHTLLDLALSWRQDLGGADALWFLRLDNVTNRLATSAVAVSTVRGLSPLPGRAVSGGVRVRF